MKPFWEITDEEVSKMLQATTWYPASLEYMRGGGFSSKFLTKAGMPVTMCRLNLIKGLGPVLQIAEGWTATFPSHVFDIIDKRTDKTWPSTFFVPRITGKGRFHGCLLGDELLGSQSWGNQLRTHRGRSDYTGFGAFDSREYA